MALARRSSISRRTSGPNNGRVYGLSSRSAIEALVAHGFVEDLVSRSSTDIEPSRLIDILRDQEAAILLVMDCIAGNRPLSKGVIHELHAILTRHQDTPRRLLILPTPARARAREGAAAGPGAAEGRRGCGELQGAEPGGRPNRPGP
jgi:hypothetical protein